MQTYTLFFFCLEFIFLFSVLVLFKTLITKSIFLVIILVVIVIRLYFIFTSCISLCTFSSFFLSKYCCRWWREDIAVVCCLFVTTTTRTIHSLSSRTLPLVDNSHSSNNKNKYATARAYCFYTHIHRQII
jgi:hypothetical protein